MHEIFCPECGSGFTAEKTRFNLSEMFKLEIDDEILAGKQAIPVYFTVEELENLKSKGQAQSNGWYSISISAESALRMIIPETNFKFDEAVQNQQLSEQTKKSLIRDLKFRPGAGTEDEERVVKIALEKMTMGNFETVNLDLKFNYDDEGQGVLQSIDYKTESGRIETLTIRYCGYCNHILPNVAGLYEQFIIGMVGTAWTGKTSYLASLAYHLVIKPTGALTNNLLTHALTDDADWHRFSEQVLYYEYGISGDATKPLKDEYRTEEIMKEWPYYSLVLQDRHRRKCIVSFVDMPGDKISSAGKSEGKTLINNQRRIFQHCKLFMICIDPTQLAHGNDNPGDYFRQSNLDEDSIKGVQIIADVIVKQVGEFLSTTGQAEKTVAIVLTKGDALMLDFPPLHKSPFPKQLLMEEEQRGDVALNLGTVIAHRQAVTRYFKKANSRLFESIMGLNCNLAFFAVSAYGKKPEKNYDLKDKLKQYHQEKGLEALERGVIEPMPKAPEGWALGIPFLWLMANVGFLPVYHEEFEDIEYAGLDSGWIRSYMHDKYKPVDTKAGRAFRGFFGSRSSANKKRKPNQSR